MASKITLTGAIVGKIWQPGTGTCGRPLHTEITRIKPRDVSNVRRDLFAIVADTLNDDGDFQSAYLSQQIHSSPSLKRRGRATGGSSENE